MKGVNYLPASTTVQSATSGAKRSELSNDASLRSKESTRGDCEKIAHEKVGIACSRCRTRKIKCSGSQPCTSCTRSGQECILHRPKPRGRKRKYIDEPGNHDLVDKRYQHGQEPIKDPGPSTATPSGSGGAITCELGRPGGRALTAPSPLAAKRQRDIQAGIGVCQRETGAFQFYGAASNLAIFQAIYEQVHQASRNNRKTSASNEPSQEMADNGSSSTESNAISLWGLDQFAFSPDEPEYSHHNGSGSCLPVYLSQELGTLFLNTYFEIAHPQFPFLDPSEIMEVWTSFWTPPPPQRGANYSSKLTSKNSCLMVLAIGAVMSTPKSSGMGPGFDAKSLGRWASYLSSRAQLSGSSFEDSSLKGVQLLLLKAIYALELMRPNDAYLYAGHAALNALALGMNRAQVADGNSPSLHRLRVTFWNIYSVEKLVSLFHGRASCLNDDFIDVSLPEDLPNPSSAAFTNHREFHYAIPDMAFVRAMAKLGRTGHRINSGIYFPKSFSTCAGESRDTCLGYEAALNEAVLDLPAFLHFFDPAMPVSSLLWQEIQRSHLGLTYYHMLLLVYRPALVLVSKLDPCDNLDNLGKKSQYLADLQDSVERAMLAAKNLISLALETYKTRAPRLRQDACIAYQVIGACLTLLFDLVRGPGKTAVVDVKATFDAVQDGITCLDYMEHYGPRFGRLTLSSRIVRVAKDAFRSRIGDTAVTIYNANTDPAAPDTTRVYEELGHNDNAPAPHTHFLNERIDSDNQLHPLADCDINALLSEFPWLSGSIAGFPTSVSHGMSAPSDETAFQVTETSPSNLNATRDTRTLPQLDHTETVPQTSQVNIFSNDKSPLVVDPRSSATDMWQPITSNWAPSFSHGTSIAGVSESNGMPKGLL